MSNRPVRVRSWRVVADSELTTAWLDRELADCDFRGERLGKRFRSLLNHLAAKPGESLPLACQDWANTKGAYRFLDNNRFSERKFWPATSMRRESEPRSVRDECLSKVIPIGQGMLGRALCEYVAHHHLERNDQGLGNALITPCAIVEGQARTVGRRSRLGGILNYYERLAA